MTTIRHVITALTAAVLLTATSCSTGPTAGDDSDPQQALAAGAQSLTSGGSARVHAVFSLPTANTPSPSGDGDLVTDGVISWQGAGGTTGEVTFPSPLGGRPTRSLFTHDAVYIDTSALGASTPNSLPGLAGKKWIKQPYSDIARTFGPVGQVITAAIDQTNPVRSTALLAQSPDLHQVGQEQINNVAATHYSGTIRYTDAVEDLRLGLRRDVLDELRREIAASGESDLQQYDLWVDEQGRPVRAQGRSTGKTGPQSYTIDYTDYGNAQPVQAPPAAEVIDKEQMLQGLGGG